VPGLNGALGNTLVGLSDTVNGLTGALLHPPSSQSQSQP
jgi:hypothetical protein